MENVKINVGDKVKFNSGLYTIEGEVLSANYYGERSGWYIEMKNANVTGGYSYWKQGYDGGKLISVNGIKVENSVEYPPRYE